MFNVLPGRRGRRGKVGCSYIIYGFNIRSKLPLVVVEEDRTAPFHSIKLGGGNSEKVSLIMYCVGEAKV